MSMWNKYGTINSDGLINARFSIYEVDYQTARNIWMSETQGDKFDLPATIVNHQGEPTLCINSQPVATLPTKWTQFVNQVKTRGPLQASTHIQWLQEKQQFRAIVSIDEV